jgi:hypothetical protein
MGNVEERIILIVISELIHHRSNLKRINQLIINLKYKNNQTIK